MRIAPHFEVPGPCFPFLQQRQPRCCNGQACPMARLRLVRKILFLPYLGFHAVSQLQPYGKESDNRYEMLCKPASKQTIQPTCLKKVANPIPSPTNRPLRDKTRSADVLSIPIPVIPFLATDNCRSRNVTAISEDLKW